MSAALDARTVHTTVWLVTSPTSAVGVDPASLQVSLLDGTLIHGGEYYLASDSLLPTNGQPIVGSQLHVCQTSLSTHLDPPATCTATVDHAVKMNLPVRAPFADDGFLAGLAWVLDEDLQRFSWTTPSSNITVSVLLAPSGCAELSSAMSVALRLQALAEGISRGVALGANVLQLTPIVSGRLDPSRAVTIEYQDVLVHSAGSATYKVWSVVIVCNLGLLILFGSHRTLRLSTRQYVVEWMTYAWTLVWLYISFFRLLFFLVAASDESFHGDTLWRFLITLTAINWAGNAVSLVQNASHQRRNQLFREWVKRRTSLVVVAVTGLLSLLHPVALCLIHSRIGGLPAFSAPLFGTLFPFREMQQPSLVGSIWFAHHMLFPVATTVSSLWALILLGGSVHDVTPWCVNLLVCSLMLVGVQFISRRRLMYSFHSTASSVQTSPEVSLEWSVTDDGVLPAEGAIFTSQKRELPRISLDWSDASPEDSSNQPVPATPPSVRSISRRTMSASSSVPSGTWVEQLPDDGIGSSATFVAPSLRVLHDLRSSPPPLSPRSPLTPRTPMSPRSPVALDTTLTRRWTVRPGPLRADGQRGKIFLLPLAGLRQTETPSPLPRTPQSLVVAPVQEMPEGGAEAEEDESNPLSHPNRANDF